MELLDQMLSFRFIIFFPFRRPIFLISLFNQLTIRDLVIVLQINQKQYFLIKLNIKYTKKI